MLEAAIVLVALALAIPAVVVGWAIGHSHRKTVTVTVGTTSAASAPIDPHVAAGAHEFTQFACAQCHGEGGKGGVSPDVPALTTVAATLTAAKLNDIITHGLGESADPQKPYMPVWRGVISKNQIADLVSYLRAGLPAVPTAEPVAVPSNQGAAVAGAALYVRYGCVNCHGPNGLGGVPNPAAEDKTIPPLTGTDFTSEFNTDKKITDIIRSGSVLGKPPIVSMPHWGGIIPPDQLAALVAYLKTLS